MRLNAPKGQKVRFLNKNGYDVQLAYAREFLEPDDIYTVKETRVYSSNTDVVLEEFPKEAFNAAMFEEVGEELEATETVKENYDRHYASRWGVTKE